jgi:hypothetical protein
MFVPSHILSQLLFLLTNEWLILPSSIKLAVNHALSSVKIALLFVISLKKLKPAVLPMLNVKRHIKGLLPSALLFLLLIVLHPLHPPQLFPLFQSQS